MRTFAIIILFKLALDYNYKGFDHRVRIDAQTLMMIMRGDFRKLGGNNNNRRPPPNQNPKYVVGPCVKCDKDHWIIDCPIDQEEKVKLGLQLNFGQEYLDIVWNALCLISPKIVQ